MDGTKHIGKGFENFLKYLVNLFLLLERQGLLEISCHPDTGLSDVVDRIYNVRFTVSVTRELLANILSVKKGLIQDSHIWSFFQSFFKQYRVDISLNRI